MKKDFLQKIFEYIEEQELIHEGDIVFTGVSGGADSMCLLEILRAYRKLVDFELRVIHVEHGIRGEASREDAAYVKRFCEERDIPCEVIAVNAASYSKTQGISVEEAARELRYEAFEQTAQEAEMRQMPDDAVHADGATDAGKDAYAGGVRIAVAHHMEDQAETVLWQMIRGSDIKGMGGMRPRRERIIRPLLHASRSQIEAFLRAEGICWREDATNSDNTYTRNRLRMDVLPVLCQLNEQAVGHLCESAGRLQEAENYLAQETDKRYGRYVTSASQGILFVRETLLEEQPLMQRRVLYRAMEAACGRAKDLGAHHVALLQDLFLHQTGRELTLPYRVTAVRTYGGVELSVKDRKDVYAKAEGEPWEQISMEVLERAQIGEISKKKYTKCFDYDKIEHSVQIRKRRSGDYLVIDSDGHKQKLKSYLVNEKIPHSERDSLWLLADGSHVMWVIGHRISDYYKVNEHTKQVLKVHYDGGNKDEREDS